MVQRSNAKPETQSPETFKTNQKRLAHRVRYACREGGLDIPSDKMVAELVALIVDERTELRDCFATMAEALVGRYENGLDDEKLEQLAYTARFFYLDDDGEIRLNWPDSELR